MATEAEVRDLLATTTVPEPVVAGVLGEASVVWLMGDRADVLAADVALCHPTLGDDEVRATVRPTATPGAWRLSVVAADRTGLLADFAASLAARELSISRATATTWSSAGLALLSVVVVDPSGQPLTTERWDELGADLRPALSRGGVAAPKFEPAPPVEVRSTPQGTGQVMVQVEAPDRIGLLWAIADWFAEQGCNIEAVQARASDGRAEVTFLATGALDTTALMTRLSGRPPAPGLAGSVLRRLTRRR